MNKEQEELLRQILDVLKEIKNSQVKPVAVDLLVDGKKIN